MKQGLRALARSYPCLRSFTHFRGLKVRPAGGPHAARSAAFIPPQAVFHAQRELRFHTTASLWYLHTRKACISLSRAAATSYRCPGSGTPAPAVYHPIAFIGTLASLCRLISRAALHWNKRYPSLRSGRYPAGAGRYLACGKTISALRADLYTSHFVLPLRSDGVRRLFGKFLLALLNKFSTPHSGGKNLNFC